MGVKPMRRVTIQILAAALVATGAAGVAALGLKSEDPVAYRSFARAPLYRAFPPTSVDLAYVSPTPGDQGFCVGWDIEKSAAKVIRENNRS